MLIHDGYWVIEWDERNGPVRGIVRVETEPGKAPVVKTTVDGMGGSLALYQVLFRFLYPIQLWDAPPRKRYTERWWMG